MFFQLLERGSLFKKAFPKGFGSLRNLARRLLEEGMLPAQVARTCGLADLQYFNKLLRQRFGRSPRGFAQKPKAK